MSDVHPHWHTTEEASTPAAKEAAPKTTSDATLIPEGAVAVSRKPAAVVGIFMVLAIGFALFEGVGGLLGQVATEEKITVRITKTGFNPATITLKPGQKVTWKNEDTIPHILFSDTLKTDKGEMLQTSPIFKDAETTVTLASDILPGDYPYASRTKSDFKATVTVTLPPPPPPAPSSEQAQSEASSAVSSQATSEMPSIPEPNTPSDTGFGGQPKEGAQTPAGGIPENPFTVGSTVPGNTAFQGKVIQGTPLIQNTKTKPASQPDSGPGAVWILGVISAGLLLVMTRKAFKAA